MVVVATGRGYGLVAAAVVAVVVVVGWWWGGGGVVVGWWWFCRLIDGLSDVLACCQASQPVPFDCIDRQSLPQGHYSSASGGI